jgi:hypothetical protein
MKPILLVRLVAMLCLAAVMTGCASMPYAPGKVSEYPHTLKLRPGEAQIERGRSNVVVDVAGNILSIPTKIILWNLKMENHHISSGTESNLVQYMADNELADVKVRLNQYAPGGEWSRLFRNKSVGAGWRYTIGMLSCLFYTVLPGRLFGGDSYNPYTDSISLYSDIPAVALHEGGHAKDFARREFKGTYAFFYALPIMALYPEGKATGDAVGYIRTYESSEEEKAAYKILYPAYGTYVGGSIGVFTPYGEVVAIAAVIPGHIAGRRKARHVEDRPAPVRVTTVETAAPAAETNATATAAAPAPGTNAVPDRVQPAQ